MRAGLNYHIEVDKHYYSVPHTLATQSIEVWISAGMIECYHNNMCIAKHIKSTQIGGQSTDVNHMPHKHKIYHEMNTDSIKAQTAAIGISVASMVEHLIAKAKHPEIGIRQACGLLRLNKIYSCFDLEAACAKALHSNILSKSGVELILKKDFTAVDIADITRGADYYH